MSRNQTASRRAHHALLAIKASLNTYYKALDTMTKTLSSSVSLVAPHWAEIGWEGEYEYMDDGSYAYCLNRLWIVTEGGAKRFLCGDWTDWERVMEDQSGEVGEAEQARIQDLGDESSCERYQAASLGVSVAFLRQVSEAGAALAYRHRDGEGSFEFPRPRAIAA